MIENTNYIIYVKSFVKEVSLDKKLKKELEEDEKEISFLHEELNKNEFQ